MLHRFYGYAYQQRVYNDGANPAANLIDVKGELYGTTAGGGSSEFYGTVFRVNTRSNEKVLYSFGGYSDGANPIGGLLDIDDTLYGTTAEGGQFSGVGDGTVFSVSTAGNETVMYVYHAEPYSPNGSYPEAGLTNVKGALYGTTSNGGVYLGGTAFSITTGGSFTNLHSFGSGSDGGRPVAPLLNVRNTLYGSTSSGGAYGKGTIFKMSLSGNEKVLHSFGYGSDGATPLAGLIDVNGTLYGTTSAGGTYGDGSVFALKP